jgi:SAM-dependent methyltransferase
MTDPLSFTGERFIPGPDGEICYEHWHRYMVAKRFCDGRSVLDVACGEGYGSDLLAEVANEVTGVDISNESIAHAQEQYRDRKNLKFIQGSCERLPLPDDSIEVAVSFETIEHLEMQEQFVSELRRVLKPGGLLLMSSPNKRLYTDARDYHNEFHVREMYRDEFEQLLQGDFPHIHWLGQKLLFHSLIWPEAGGTDAMEYFLMTPEGIAPADHPGVEAMYYLVVCSADAGALGGIENKLSFFSHSSESVYTDYTWVTRRAIELDKTLKERDGTIASLRQQLDKQAGLGWWLKSPWRFVKSWFASSE